MSATGRREGPGANAQPDEATGQGTSVASATWTFEAPSPPVRGTPPQPALHPGAPQPNAPQPAASPATPGPGHAQSAARPAGWHAAPVPVALPPLQPAAPPHAQPAARAAPAWPAPGPAPAPAAYRPAQATGWPAPSPPANRAMPMATASLVLGIVSAVAWLALGLSIVTGIIGAALGVQARKRIRRDPTLPGTRRAKLGTILSGIGMVLGILFWAIVMAVAVEVWDECTKDPAACEEAGDPVVGGGLLGPVAVAPALPATPPAALLASAGLQPGGTQPAGGLDVALHS